jgi:hypothetical protein
MSTPKKKYRESVVYDATHIPPEYLPLGDLHNTETTLHRYLVKQCEAGNVMRFRFGRLLFVHKDHIEQARKRYQSTDGVEHQAGERADQHYESVCESLADIADTIGGHVPNLFGLTQRMVIALERLATAAEAIATQPKKDDFAEFTNN